MKKVTLEVEMSFEVPDDTEVAAMTVEFPGGNPVVHTTMGVLPIPGQQFCGHTTRNVVNDDDDDNAL